MSGTAQSEQIINASAGTYSATATVTDPQSHQYQAYCSVTVQSATLTITTPPPDGSVNVSYSQPLNAVGGAGAYTWSVTSGSLPPGLTLSPSSGVVSGTPTTDGLYGFILTVADAGNHSASQNSGLRITVIRITTTSLQSGQAGSYYSQQLSATGGIGCCTWYVVGAPTPAPTLATPKLYLSADGVLSGYPAVVTTSMFTVRATDQRGNYANATLSVTANPNGSTIAGSSSLHVNLSYMPFGVYDESHAASGNFSTSCPSGWVRDCFYNRNMSPPTGVLPNLRAQGVSGVRIFVTLCNRDDPVIANCGNAWNATVNAPYWNPSINPAQAAWIANAGNFFQDVHDAGIQNVTITIVHDDASPGYTCSPGPLSPPCVAVNQSPVTSPSGSPCNDTPARVYYLPTEPFGLKADGSPIGEDQPSSTGVNCAPINPIFVGWKSQLDVIDALLGAAAGKVNMNELEFEQELNPQDFTVHLRLIYDNAHYSSAPASPSQCLVGGTWVDIVCFLQDKMSKYSFDPSRVAWSGGDAYALTAGDEQTGQANCGNVYGDYARNMPTDQVASAIGAGLIGLPHNYDAVSYPLLICGGDTSTMFQVPIPGHPQPSIVDAHIYPQILDVNMMSSAQVQNEAKISFDDLRYFLTLVNPTGQVMIGETHYWGNQSILATNTGAPDYLPVHCGDYYITNPDMTHTVYSYPSSAPHDTVMGFNASTLATYGYGVVFRPWMELEDNTGKCYPYDVYQRVNYQGGGPFTPKQ